MKVKLLIILLLTIGMFPVLGTGSVTYHPIKGNNVLDISYGSIVDTSTQNGQWRCASFSGLGNTTIHQISGTHSMLSYDRTVILDNGNYTVTGQPYSIKQLSQDNILVLLSPVNMNSSPDPHSYSGTCQLDNGTLINGWTALAKTQAIEIAHDSMFQYNNGAKDNFVSFNNMEIYVPPGYYLTILESPYAGDDDFYLNDRFSAMVYFS